MGGSTTTEQQGSSSQINQIPQWVQNAGQQNYGLAQQVASQPLQQYQGQMVADVAPQTQQAWNLAANSGNVGQDAQNAAQAGYLNTLGQTPQNVQAGQLSQHQSAAVHESVHADRDQRDVADHAAESGTAAEPAAERRQFSANAFGGSRQGIQQGVTQAQGAQNMAQMAQQLNQANFTQAQAGAQGDIANTLKAQQGNQSAALQQGALANQASAGPGHARQSADAEQHRQLRHVDLGRRLRAAAGAEPDQCAIGQVQSGLPISAAATGHDGIVARA